MNLYFSLERVPELRGLRKTQRLAVLMYYQANKVVKPGSRAADNAFVGMIILAEIAGLAGGVALYGSSSFWWPILGAQIAMAFVMSVFYLGMLYVEAPKFRSFLKADHSQRLLRNLGLPTVTPATAQESEPFGHQGTDKRNAIPGDQMAEALVRIQYGAARVSEVTELGEHAANQAIQLFNAVQLKQHEGRRALWSLRLRKFLRLNREAAALRDDAFRLLRQAGEVLQHAETNLSAATALQIQIQRESQQ